MSITREKTVFPFLMLCQTLEGQPLPGGDQFLEIVNPKPSLLPLLYGALTLQVTNPLP